MAGSPALVARLLGERYGLRPAEGVTRRCLPGGISRCGDRSPRRCYGPIGGCQGIRPSCWACAAASVRLAAPIMSPYRSRCIKWDASACCGTGEEGRHSYRLDASLWPLGVEGQRDGEQCGGDDGPQHQHGLLLAQALRSRRLARRGRWAIGGPRRPRIFSLAGISSPAASRLKMFSMEASLGSEQARPFSMQPRACLSGSLRLIITSEAGARAMSAPGQSGAPRH